MMYQAKLAFRSLIYRKKQYVSLFLVCMFGVAVSLAAIAVSTGMMRSLRQKARIYYGGDFALMCSDKDASLKIYDYEEKCDVVRAVLPPDAVVTPRMALDGRVGQFYFEGVQAFMQTVVGINIENEASLLSSFFFVEGGVDEMVGHRNGVLISAPVARMLCVHVGDEITFQLETTGGFVNTVQIEVRGIFQDSSVFGTYTSYMDFDFLKAARGYPENYANRICVNFPGRKVTEKNLHEFYDSLRSVLNMYRWVDDKGDFISSADSIKVGTWGFIPLSANLSEVEIMGLAMDAVITFIIIILAVIIIAGIGSTYRVLIMKRITEIGVYMAVGMRKRSIAGALLLEAFALLLVGCLGGIVLADLFCSVLSVFDFSFIPSFDMFLERGNLCPRPDVIKSVAVIVSVIVATLLAVLYAAMQSIKIMPVEALAVTE